MATVCVFADLYIINEHLILLAEASGWNDLYIHESGEVTSSHEDKINLPVVVAAGISDLADMGL